MASNSPLRRRALISTGSPALGLKSWSSRNRKGPSSTFAVRPFCSTSKNGVPCPGTTWTLTILPFTSTIGLISVRTSAAFAGEKTESTTDQPSIGKAASNLVPPLRSKQRRLGCSAHAACRRLLLGPRFTTRAKLPAGTPLQTATGRIGHSGVQGAGYLSCWHGFHPEVSDGRKGNSRTARKTLKKLTPAAADRANSASRWPAHAGCAL